ncbi:hypothetical protein F5Y10DRAFT_252198 [Nemania abortiva]|nr:hypothetical protein F5Y10DRAFT_252198 [Nemania abortiva]
MASSDEGKSLEFQFHPVKDDSAFRTQNRTGEIQRAHIIDDDISGLLVQADLNTVAHGHNTKGPATLIEIMFRFIGLGSKRRFRRVQISIHFEDEKKRASQDPEVVGLWPDGDYTLSTTEGTAEETRSGALTISPGFSGFGGTIGATLNWTKERRTSHATKDRTYIVGTKRIEGRNWGKKNAVRLDHFENETQKSGIITELRTGILLNRSSDDRFLAHVVVDATADWVYSTQQVIQRLLRTSLDNDPVIFDPTTAAVLNSRVKDIDPRRLDKGFVALSKVLSTNPLPTPTEATTSEAGSGNNGSVSPA